MWQLGMAKARQIHTNVTKNILRIQEEITKKPKKPAHSEVIDQLKAQKPLMETMKLQYETIVTTGQIPNMDPPQPTTSSVLRKKMVEDTLTLGYITPFKIKIEKNKCPPNGNFVFQDIRVINVKLYAKRVTDNIKG